MTTAIVFMFIILMIFGYAIDKLADKVNAINDKLDNIESKLDSIESDLLQISLNTEKSKNENDYDF